MTLEDLKAATQYDPKAVWQLVTFETDLPESLKVPSACRIKAVMEALLNAFAPDRSVGFKALGALDNTPGEIMWRDFGHYKVKHNRENFVREITFQGGDDRVAGNF